MSMLKKIKVFETFAGIGAQHKALEILKQGNKNFEYEVVATSEWDVWANISYNAVHHDNKNIVQDFEKNKSEILNFLRSFKHSMDSKKEVPFEYLERRLDNEMIQLLYSSYKNSNNLGSILDITAEKLLSSINDETIDLITYSFPCQDLSVAGSFHGFNAGMKKGSGTRSGLLWEIERILSDLFKSKKLPKYLLLENVKNMLSEKHKDDYLVWLKILGKFGYNTKTFILDAEKFGIPQHRERVYALSVLGDEEYLDSYNENNGFKIVETCLVPNNVSEKYDITKQMKDVLKVDYKNNFNKNEAEIAILNNTPSRTKMYLSNYLLYTKNEKELYKHPKIKLMRESIKKHENSFYFSKTRTLTTKQDRNPNAGIVSIKDCDINTNNKKKLPYRFITNREAFLFMGFSDKDVDKIYKHLSYKNRKDILYRQAGNSIVVNVLVAIFDYMVNKKWKM